jgi:hypothetical protein
MTVIIRKPAHTVVVNGSTLTDVLSARTQHGYNLSVAEAEIETRSLPTGLEPLQTAVISMGGTAGTSHMRFNGMVIASEPQYYPQTYKLVCRGNLIKADLYHCPQSNGVDMSGEDGSMAGDTDENYVWSMLQNAGLYSTRYTLDIDGTSTTMGTVSGGRKHGAFIFLPSETALSWIQKLDAICLGYRTFDMLDGTIARKQITATPGTTAAFTFTEGVDIFRAPAQDSVIDAKNRIMVTGFSDGISEAASAYVHHKHYEVQAHNPWFTYGSDTGGWFYVPHQISSPMIERSLTADSGAGLACQDVANWLLAELNQRRIRVTLTTPRDDLIEPGDTIAIDSTTRLGINQNFWVQQVECSLDRKNHFEQVLTCLGKVADPVS